MELNFLIHSDKSGTNAKETPVVLNRAVAAYVFSKCFFVFVQHLYNKYLNLWLRATNTKGRLLQLTGR